MMFHMAAKLSYRCTPEKLSFLRFVQEDRGSMLSNSWQFVRMRCRNLEQVTSGLRSLTFVVVISRLSRLVQTANALMSQTPPNFNNTCWSLMHFASGPMSTRHDFWQLTMAKSSKLVHCARPEISDKSRRFMCSCLRREHTARALTLVSWTMPLKFKEDNRGM